MLFTASDACLFPLRIYTALKQSMTLEELRESLFPLRIYTALKPLTDFVTILSCLFPLRIYTALKLLPQVSRSFLCLFPLRIYTALKRKVYVLQVELVCFPYEFTLLSNIRTFIYRSKRFVSPTNLHCSQTSNRPRIIFCKIPVSLHRSYHSSLY